MAFCERCKKPRQLNKPKRKTFSAKVNQKLDELLTYSLKAYNIYSQAVQTADRSNCQILLNQLISYYQEKKIGDKVAYYQETLKGL